MKEKSEEKSENSRFQAARLLVLQNFGEFFFCQIFFVQILFNPGSWPPV
jgi:hypothetical protein